VERILLCQINGRNRIDAQTGLRGNCSVLPLLHLLTELDPYTDYWKTFHNNVALKGSVRDNDDVVKEWVYKVFDNRFLPTERKPENWLGKPWSEHLQAEEYLVYEERDGVRKYLWKPMEEISTLQAKGSGHGNPSPRKKHKTDSDKFLEYMPYGIGSIVVIRYKYQNDAPHCVQTKSLPRHCSQHSKNARIGYGSRDIRGHNLLHLMAKLEASQNLA
jgi:hypothetical protein